MSRFERTEVVTWEQRLQRSYSVEEVISVANDFIATWGPAELTTLPEPLRPPRFRDADDVGLYAFKLMSRPGMGSNSHILARMVTFFTTASQRLSQISAVAADEQARARAEDLE